MRRAYFNRCTWKKKTAAVWLLSADKIKDSGSVLEASLLSIVIDRS